LGILCPEVCRVRVVSGEPCGRGMNRKKRRAEQPTKLWHLIFSCSLSVSLSPYAHNTWTSQMHNTVPMGHTNNCQQYNKSLTYLPLGGNFGEHIGFLVGTHWEQRNQPNNPTTPIFPKRKIWA